MKYREVCLGTFLRKSEDWIQPNPDELYKQITARLWGKGLTLRAKVTGGQIAAARQVRAKAGQFLISRIDARHGAFGLVPPELDGALVSGDFPCFDIDVDVVESRYLEWFTKTDNFIDLCRRSSEGSTNRVRLKERKFLEMTIPLPPLDEQRRTVAKLDKVAALLEERQQAIKAAEREAQAMLFNAFRQAIDCAPCRPMAEIAPLVRRPVDVRPDGIYSELGVRSFGRGTFHKPVLPGVEIGSKKLFRIREGDLLFNIVFAWEGAVAVAQPKDDGRVGSHRFLTCVPEPNLATAEFLRFYFSTADGLQKLGEASPGGAGRNRTLGLKKLDAIEVPVPPIEKQRWFDRLQSHVKIISTIREQTGADVQALIPAVLHQVLRSGAEANEGRQSERGAERSIRDDFRRRQGPLVARRIA